MSNRFETRSAELNSLLGGGLNRGEGVLIKYHAETIADRIFVNIGLDVVNNMLSAVLFPRQTLSQDEIKAYLNLLNVSLETLITNDQLFIIDTEDRWETQENVFHVDSLAEIQEATETALERSRARGTVHMMDSRTIEATVGTDDAKTLRKWQQEDAFRGTRDFLVEAAFVPHVSADLLGFYESMDTQIISLETVDDSVQLTVEAGADAAAGQTRTVEYLTESPFFRIV